jgi:hypothetical protein
MDKFDWKFYIFIYDDLKHINNENSALEHYILYGKKEKRLINKYDKIYYKINNIKLHTCYEKFDYEFYTEFYIDINNIKTKKNAFLHWMNIKDTEYRFCDRNIYIEFTKFDYEYYLILNNNIKHKINTEEKAYIHWINTKNSLIENNIININKQIDNKNIFISFIIVSNGKNTLIHTINSLYNLNDSNWNALIIFDGVKNTFDIKDKRINIIEVEIEKKDKLKNNKIGLLRNIGFKYINNSDWIGFVDDDDFLSFDYIDRLKEEININNNIDVCLFRMGYDNKQILPNNYDRNITKCRVGISFAIRSYVTKNILFNTFEYSNYYYLKELEYKNYKIVISPYICYFVNAFPYSINKKYERIYI